MPGRWSGEEIKVLVDSVTRVKRISEVAPGEELSDVMWETIADELPGRDPKACKRKYKLVVEQDRMIPKWPEPVKEVRPTATSQPMWEVDGPWQRLPGLLRLLDFPLLDTSQGSTYRITVAAQTDLGEPLWAVERRRKE